MAVDTVTYKTITRTVSKQSLCKYSHNNKCKIRINVNTTNIQTGLVHRLQ